MSAPISYWPRIERWLGWAAWAGLGLEAVLWAVLIEAPIENLVFLLCLLVVLLPGVWVCAALLVIRYRRFFGTWVGFAGLVATMALVSGGRGLDLPAGVTGLLLMGLIGLMIALPVGMIVLLWSRDRSVALIGLSLLAFLWGSLLASVPYGGPIRVWLYYTGGAPAGQFWWFETLTCLLTLALPLGSLAFFAHLIRLMAQEARGQ